MGTTDQEHRSRIIENRVLKALDANRTEKMTQWELAWFAVEHAGFRVTDTRVERYWASVHDLIQAGRIVVDATDHVYLPEVSVETANHDLTEIFEEFNRTSTVRLVIVGEYPTQDIISDIVTGAARPVVPEPEILAHAEPMTYVVPVLPPEGTIDLSPEAVAVTFSGFTPVEYNEDDFED